MTRTVSPPQASSENPAIFPGFAMLWAIATLIHQLAFTFWTESWPGWVLVVLAVAVLRQPACLSRFLWMVSASLINLIQKLPFVPNHILFEGMLHIIMLLGALHFWRRHSGGVTEWLRGDFRNFWGSWQSRLLVGGIILKAIYLSLPEGPKNHLAGSLTTLALLAGISLYLSSRKPMRGGEAFLAQTAPVIRVAIIMMYCLAVLQKLNRDYFNPDVSCAAVLHKDIAVYFWGLVPEARWALHGAIWGSLIFELGIPILLSIPKTRAWGYLAAVWFHLWLAIHPAAGVYSFSALILAVLWLFLPSGAMRELTALLGNLAAKAGRGDAAAGARYAFLGVVTFFFITLSIQISLYLSLGRSFKIFDIANRFGFGAFLIWGLFIGVCYVIAVFRAKDRENHYPNAPVPTLAWLGLFIVLLNGISPWIGGKTQTSFSMYSNLRSEGRGNHFFLKRIDLFPFQKDMVTVIASKPDVLDPTSRPRGIANFANPGNKVLPYFELRRLITTTQGDLEISYERAGEVLQFTRKNGTVSGDATLDQPIPLVLQKLLWFRRLNALEGPMTCTH